MNGGRTGSGSVTLDPVEISVLDNALASVCEQMGQTLARCAVSPNIRDRLDFSAALFDRHGTMVAQAAHIPVHLGSMAFALKMMLERMDPGPDEMVLTNDPYRGGTHLPDLTLVAPVFVGGRRIGYVANRAHHADVGGSRGASMAPARRIDEEGVVIPPAVVWRGRLLSAPLEPLLAAVRQPDHRRADLMAQVAANEVGVRELGRLARRRGVGVLRRQTEALLDASERSMRSLAARLPRGRFAFTDHLDDDGFDTSRGVPIRVQIERSAAGIRIDFAGSSPCVEGNLNAVLPVTVAAVFYVFRCLLGEDVPANAGCLRALEIVAEPGTVVNATRPHAVAAGNVETSQRVVDALLGALAGAWPERIPAASCGSMNNLSLAAPGFAYYETIAGGMGASPRGDGLSAVHTHMTNTRNTPVEALELSYPISVRRYAIRRGSGGAGRYGGGDGVVKELEALVPMTCALLTERRRLPPWGLAGGRPGRRGLDVLWSGGRRLRLPGKTVVRLAPGDRIAIATPGGGGHGAP